VDPSVEARLDTLEESLGRLLERIERLERQAAPPPPVRAEPSPVAAQPPPAAAPPRPESRPRLDLPDTSLEDLLGGRVLRDRRRYPLLRATDLRSPIPVARVFNQPRQPPLERVEARAEQSERRALRRRA
jgi:hypothetical protein